MKNIIMNDEELVDEEKVPDSLDETKLRAYVSTTEGISTEDIDLIGVEIEEGAQDLEGFYSIDEAESDILSLHPDIHLPDSTPAQRPKSSPMDFGQKGQKKPHTKNKSTSESKNNQTNKIEISTDRVADASVGLAAVGIALLIASFANPIVPILGVNINTLVPTFFIGEAIIILSAILGWMYGRKKHE